MLVFYYLVPVPYPKDLIPCRSVEPVLHIQQFDIMGTYKAQLENSIFLYLLFQSFFLGNAVAYKSDPDRGGNVPKNYS